MNLFRNTLEYYRENGVWLTYFYTLSRVVAVFRNFFLSRKLHAGKNLRVGPGADLRGLSNIQIGDNFVSGVGLRLEAVIRHGGSRYSPKIIIKDNVLVSDYVHIGAVNHVEIGSGVLMGSKVYITDHGHGTYSGPVQSRPEEPPNARSVKSDKSVILEDNVWLGESVTVLSGVRIGFGSIIGSNSVVTKDIPPYCIAVGAPAKVVKKWDQAARKWERA